MLIGKSIFEVNLPRKLFRDGATVVNADTGNLKYLHKHDKIFDTYLNHMPAKLELNRMVRNV